MLGPPGRLSLSARQNSSPNPNISAGKCYYKAGAEAADNFIPCGNSAFGHYTCCQVGDNCIAADACFNYSQGITYIASCTDPTYRSPSCPQKGTVPNQQWSGITQCDAAAGTWVNCQEAPDAVVVRDANPSCTCAGRKPLFTASAFLEPIAQLPPVKGASISWFKGHEPGPSLTPTPTATAGTTKPVVATTTPQSGSESPKPGSGSSQPGSGSPQPGSGGSGSPQPGSGGSGSSQPGSGSQQPGSGSQQPGYEAPKPGSDPEPTAATSVPLLTASPPGTTGAPGSNPTAISYIISTAISVSVEPGAAATGPAAIVGTSPNELSQAAKIGIGVGTGVGAWLLIGVLIWIFISVQKKKKRRKLMQTYFGKTDATPFGFARRGDSADPIIRPSFGTAREQQQQLLPMAIASPAPVLTGGLDRGRQNRTLLRPAGALNSHPSSPSRGLLSPPTLDTGRRDSSTLPAADPGPALSSRPSTSPGRPPKLTSALKSSNPESRSRSVDSVKRRQDASHRGQSDDYHDYLAGKSSSGRDQSVGGGARRKASIKSLGVRFADDEADPI
ncbi:uncharacterized protein B0I36DRAFT_364043 [Microdochium trichocladiopsis]|uniref:Uncharacterized protein n=1 Tax=Microdochium trichocladiopsis TaxID=1682393 RepID=A0A9P8Y525_9PEZI|nr:uncharacterized protein B0I36DRAFT_364043 [Microdochium trichocladiopsis]KAH7029509.1 hypothetical protein B0I36DRAFT_364043 [Microdochium trichocladiopsis]